MKYFIMSLAVLWVIGFGIAAGAINNAKCSSYYACQYDGEKEKATARALLFWPYYIGKYL